jgi:hypothetical protein
MKIQISNVNKSFSTFTKNVVTFMILISVSVILASSLLKAQPDPPCEMDCNEPWQFDQIGPFALDSVNCPGCFVYIDFWYRDNACNGLFKDLQLGEITLSLACISCNNYTIEDVVAFAKDKMIREHKKWPNPNPGNPCEDNWRAFESSCWGEWFVNGNRIIKPCLPAQCCWQKLRVCPTPFGGIFYYTLTMYAPDEEDCYLYPYPCEFTCRFAPEPPEKQGINYNSDNGFLVVVYPNPANNHLTIQFESEKTGVFNLEIYDISGNKIYEKPISKLGESTYIELNLSSFSNGIYNYSILLDGKTGITGKFTVQK